MWDLAGKIARLPVHALMGTYRNSILGYASSQVLPDVAAYVDQAQTFKANGWRPTRSIRRAIPTQDIKVCEAVRKAVGDDYRLMLDSTWSYNYTDALRVGRAIEEMGYYWYEDPLADEDIYNYVKLREKLDIPIMATEFPAGGLDTYPIWLTEHATDYLRGDIPNKGGLTTMLKTAHLGEAFGLQVRGAPLGQFAEQPGEPASVHGAPQHHDVRGAAAGRRAQIRDGEGAGDRPRGLLHAPTGPGLAAEIDFELIKRKTEAVLTIAQPSLYLNTNTTTIPYYTEATDSQKVFNPRAICPPALSLRAKRSNLGHAVRARLDRDCFASLAMTAL